MNTRGTHIADALKYLRQGGAVVPGWRHVGSSFSGEALPIECVWEPFRDLETDEYSTEAIAEAIVPGSVPVIAAHEDARAVFGPIAALSYARSGARGVVVDGAIRGPAEMEAMRFPVLTRHQAILSGYGQVRRRVVEKVIVSGFEVRAGDLIICDGGNLAVVPATVREEVMQYAATLRAADDELMSGLADGANLKAIWSNSERHHLTNRDRSTTK